VRDALDPARCRHCREVRDADVHAQPGAHTTVHAAAASG
jgi:hypothetical protein